MICPRCEAKAQFITEYFNFTEQYLVRDHLCTTCGSAITEHFHNDGTYKSDWIDLNV